MPAIDPKKLTHLDAWHGLPLLVVDEIEILPNDAIRKLLIFAKSFVDKGIGVFVFVLTSGAKGKEFISQSAMSRVELLYVGDLSEHETLSFFKEPPESGGRQRRYVCFSILWEVAGSV
eukprot:3773066-Rhodomonas_salina.1